MKGFVYFIIAVIVLTGFGSAFWWLADGSTPEEQLEYLKVTFSESVEGSAASNTAESASRLGKVLKDNLTRHSKFMNTGRKPSTNKLLCVKVLRRVQLCCTVPVFCYFTE